MPHPDARTADVVDVDVCIVGAGPAGLTVAEGLGGLGMRVAVVESGGHGGDPRGDQDLMRGRVVGDVYGEIHRLRARGVGGTARIWTSGGPAAPAARFVPLDALDMERRPGLHDGWPIGRAELEPYYARARELLGLPSPADVLTPAVPPLLPLDPQVVVSRIATFRPARLLLDDLPRRLEAIRAVRLLTHATVTELATDGDRVASVRAVRPDGRRLDVRARVFVLAAGAFENTRLLLASAAGAGGLGNARDLVGRFLMDHPMARGGRLHPHRRALIGRLGAYDLQAAGDGSRQATLALAEPVMRREGLANGTWFLVPRRRGERAQSVRALREMLRGAGVDRRRVAAAARGLDDVVARTMQVAGWPTPAPYLIGDGGWSRPGAARRLRDVELLHQTEQLPDRDNRLVLGTERDATGVPRPVVHWRWTDRDRESVARAQAILAAELRRAGVGVVRPDGDGTPELDQGSLHHPLGTTRMSRSPADGVVDTSLRVHDVPNLYVLGGSVFPSGGYANPTLTILALALRLRDHLAPG